MTRAVKRIEAERAALATTTTQIAEIEARRNLALIADADDKAAKLFGELETLRARSRGHSDKIALLEAEAKRERAEAILRGHKALIGRFAKALDGSDADLTEAAELISQAWKKISSGIDKRHTRSHGL